MVDSMTTDTRRRILLTDTPALSAMIERHARPGEARSATVLRLAARGDQPLGRESGLPVFGGLKAQYRAVSAAEILAAMDDDDDRNIAHG
jgi:hypothetical protein